MAQETLTRGPCNQDHQYLRPLTYLTGKPVCKACGMQSASQLSHSVVSNSLRPQGLQHARRPSPSITNSRSLL